MNKKQSINGADRILQLPDHLFDHIFSFLPLDDAVRTSILSKKWENLWITAFSTFVFDIDFFKDKTKRVELLNFVERTLRSRHSHSHRRIVNTQKLVLCFPIYSSEVATILDRCIRYAIGCNVKEMDLYIIFLDYGLYDLSRIVLAAKSLTKLSLFRCKLEFSSCINMSFFSSLKILSLSSVIVNDQTLQNLMSNCPAIETLQLDYLYDRCDRILKISSLVNPKLESVKIGSGTFERIEIEVPGLKCLSIGLTSNYLPIEINVSTCKNIRSLFLDHLPITDEWLHNVNSKLCLLESLSLENCDMLESIKISSCRLKDLNVKKCRGLLNVEIDVPDLRLFNYVGQNVIFFSSNSLALWSARISLKPTTADDPHWYTKLTEFLGNFSNSNFLTLSIKDVIIPKESRESLIPPLYNVEYLMFELHQELLDQSVEETMDGLLWLCPHPEFLSIALHNGKTLELKDAHIAEILSLRFVFPTKKNKGSEKVAKSCYFLASGGRDRMIHLYDVERNFDLIESIDDHYVAVTSVKVTCNGSKIISCGADRSLIFLNVNIMDTGCKVLRCHQQMASHGIVYDMALDPMMEAVITVGQVLNLNFCHHGFNSSVINEELIRTMSFSDHEAFDHPVACLIVVSSKDEQPINKFVDLFNTDQLPSILKDGAMDPKIPKQYMLVHDNQDGTSEKYAGHSFLFHQKWS